MRHAMLVLFFVFGCSDGDESAGAEPDRAAAAPGVKVRNAEGQVGAHETAGMTQQTSSVGSHFGGVSGADPGTEIHNQGIAGTSSGGVGTENLSGVPVGGDVATAGSIGKQPDTGSTSGLGGATGAAGSVSSEGPGNSGALDGLMGAVAGTGASALAGSSVLAGAGSGGSANSCGLGGCGGFSDSRAGAGAGQGSILGSAGRAGSSAAAVSAGLAGSSGSSGSAGSCSRAGGGSGAVAGASAIAGSGAVAGASAIAGSTGQPIAAPVGTLWDNGAQKRLGHSEVHFKLDGTATRAIVQAQSLFATSTGTLLGPSVFADGKLLGTMAIPVSRGQHEQQFVFPLGTTSLVVRNGPAQENGGVFANVFIQSYATGVVVSGASLLLPVAPSHRYVVYGDSVAEGWNADVPGIEGWPMLLRAMLAGDSRLTVYGCGGYALADEVKDAALWESLASRLSELLDGTLANAIVMAVGINDAVSNSRIWGSANAFGSALGMLVDGIHLLRPSAQIFVLGAHTCTNVLGSSESQVAPYRSALLAVAQPRSPWCSAIDASRWTIAMDATDTTYLHPNKYGHAALAANIRTALGL
jgi:lysophospholipase L1-like esterase